MEHYTRNNLVIWIAFVFLCVCIFPVHLLAIDNNLYVENEILVKFKPGITKQQKETSRDSIRSMKTNEISAIGVEQWKLPEDISVEDALTILKNNVHIEYAEPNYISTLNAIPNDPDFNLQWSLLNEGQEVNGSTGTADADIQLSDAWDIYTGTNEIVVAVIDSGCAVNHPDLLNNIWTNEAELYGAENVDDDQNGYMDDFCGYNFIPDFPQWQVGSDFFVKAL